MKTDCKDLLKLPTILCWVQGLFVIIALITIGVLVIQFGKILCYEESSQTFFSLILSWHFVKNLFIACFSLITLYVAGSQLKKQSDTACINSLAELRSQLTTGRNRQVHFSLFPEDEKTTLSDDKKTTLSDDKKATLSDDKKATLSDEDKIDKEVYDLKKSENIPMIDVYNYLGTLGLGIQMTKRKLIDMDSFYSQFGYRIENIFEGESTEHINVRKHIYSSKFYYQNLLWIYREIQKWKIKNHNFN